MPERFKHFSDWDHYLSMAQKNIDSNLINELWQKVYARHVVFTEIELKNLGVSYNSPLSDIPEINKVQNVKQIDPKRELVLIEIIGMPAAGKDTMILDVEKQKIPNVVCTPQEGYYSSQKEFPFPDLRTRHFQVYGGTDMEADDIIDSLTFYNQKPTGAVLLNRTIPDNFLAFGYTLFLGGYIGVNDLVQSQRMFHFFQYSPTRKVGNKYECLDNLTAATMIFMVRPEVSLERRSKRGRILNTDFLNLLYSQYLRMTSRLKTMNQRNLVVLDMSGTINENRELFQKTLETIVKI